MSELLLMAKQLMDASDAMHDSACAKFGERSYIAMYALQGSLANFLVYCEAERLNHEQQDKDAEADGY
jgi:hypothetical protein